MNQKRGCEQGPMGLSEVGGTSGGSVEERPMERIQLGRSLEKLHSY